MTTKSIPTNWIAIVIPVLNEARHIDTCLTTLLHGCDADGLSVMVMDGGSTDATATIVRAWSARDHRVSLHENPQRLQSAAINLAARIAPAGVTMLLRADAHAVYPPGFVRMCADAMAAHAATSVVVPMRTVGHGGFGHAVAAVQNSWLGHGGSGHRTRGASGFVEHGHHAAFDRAFFLGLGGYDGTMSHNEDAELDVRALRQGGRIWMCAEAAIGYIPRDGVLALLRQYRRHGAGRARTLLRHRIRPRLRQVLPVMVVLGIGGAAVMSLLHPGFALPVGGYAASCLGWGGVLAVRRRDWRVLGAGVAAMAMHVGWGCGFIGGVAAHLKPVRALDTE